MKKLFLFTLLFLSPFWTFGQVCGTPSPINPTIYPNNENAREASSAICVNVFFILFVILMVRLRLHYLIQMQL